MMYTVIRFTWEEPILGKIKAIGDDINIIRPGIYSGLNGHADGFTCSVCDHDKWQVHEHEINRFLTELRSVVDYSRNLGATITIDIAVFPEDTAAFNYIFGINLEIGLIELLATCGVRLEISYYLGETDNAVGR